MLDVCVYVRLIITFAIGSNKFIRWHEANQWSAMNSSEHNSITAQLALIQIQEIGKIGGKNNMTHEKSKLTIR